MRPNSAEADVKMNEYQKIYEQSVVCVNPGVHENFADGFESAELLRHNTSKSGDVQISLKKNIIHMKESHSEIDYIMGETHAPKYLIDEPPRDCRKERWPQEVLRADCRVHEDRVPWQARSRLRGCWTDDVQHLKARGWTEQTEGVLWLQGGGPERQLRHHKLYEQLAEYKKPETHADSDDGTETGALVMFNTSKPEDKQNEPKEYVDCKMEDQSHNYVTTGENKNHEKARLTSKVMWAVLWCDCGEFKNSELFFFWYFF